MLKALAVTAVAAALLAPAAPVLAANSPPFLVSACLSSLNGKRQIVRKETVRSIDRSWRVHVQPFCLGIQYNDLGNAAGLGKTIGANPVLAAALANRGWRADDVTSIVVSGHSVTLYVHRD